MADRVRLTGLASTVGLISSDYGGEETYPIDIEGEAFDSPPPALDPTSNDDPPTRDPAYTRAAGHRHGYVGRRAGPSAPGRAAHGRTLHLRFRAAAAVGAGSHATWELHGKDLVGRARNQEVAAAFSAWPLIIDGTFENDWPESVAGQLFRGVSEEGPVINGGYSLVVRSGGGRASFRLRQPAGTKRLRFLASAKPVSDPDPHHPLYNAEYGVVLEYAVPKGAVIGAALTATATSCADYPDFCNPDGDPNNPLGPGVFDFTLDVPESSEPREVLLRLSNHNYTYGGPQEMPILVDDLRFE